MKDTYNTELKPAIQKELGVTNAMEIPRITKIVLNVGVGEATMSKGVVEKVQEQISLIAGQKAVVTRARKSVSAFKVRKGLPIGVKVTLRGDTMYVFLEKLIRIVIPRIRDFRGIPESSVDSYGNLNLGLNEQTLFPEIEFDKIDKVRGLQITVVTTAGTKERGTVLFTQFGVPFVK